MEPQTVPMASGARWFADGWHTFRSKPGLWLLLIVVYIAIAFVLNLIPLVGGPAFNLIAPGLAAGMLYVAHEVRTGGDPQIANLFFPLRDTNKRGAMLTLGALSLGAVILAQVVLLLAVGGSMGAAGMSSAAQGESADLAMGAVGVGAILGILVALAIGVLLALAMLYGVPLVLFTRTRVVEALKASLRAVRMNIPAVLVFGLIYLVLAIIATIPFGLGFLILGPVTFGAVYASFREVFPAAVEQPAEAEG